MSQRVDAAMVAEQRIQRFSVLASQIGSFIVVVYEASQAGVGVESRTIRLEGLTADIRRTFAQARRDLEAAVGEAARAGLDEQSRRATRSIGIARMEAIFDATVKDVLSARGAADPARLQGLISAFSIGFDPLLNGAITAERRARDEAVAEIGALQRRLTWMALAVGAGAALALIAFNFGLVRPQMARLDALRRASEEIGRENFAVSLPAASRDEIGALFRATNRMAAELARRKAHVDAEWTRLNATIAARTEELRRANDALAKTDEDRRRFFADVSHELRTPLTVILMEAELALKAGAAAEGPLGVIQTRARRLNRRIDDLLRIARSEAGRIALRETRFDLCEAVREAAADMAGQAASAGVSLGRSGPETLDVTGDPDWVRQVVGGLIENAVRHAKAGGAAHLAVSAAGDFGSVEVIDNGPGVSAADRRAVFERFGQGAGGARGEGFGIGLSLARWIVERQGGRIAMTSPAPPERRLGAEPGTIVTVSFPLARD